jgi:hypothetical protein
MNTQELRSLQEAYLEVYQELDEGYQEPRFNRKDYLAKLSKRGGMGMGTPEDPHGYRDPGMEKVGAEFSERTAAAKKAKETGEPDSYIERKKAQSKLKKEQVDIYDIILSHLLDEGYAETPEAAEAIMVNMSEEWRESIITEVNQEPLPPKKPFRKKKPPFVKPSSTWKYGSGYADQGQGGTKVRTTDKDWDE